MPKLLISLLVVTLLLQVVKVQCCERSTFTDAKLKASKYFHLADDLDDIKLEETLTGCITPSEELKDAVRITVKNQQVPILHEGAVQDMEWLHDLKMEENGIKEIKPGAFQNLPTISTISLAKNQLKAIAEGIFNGLAVKRLCLNDNSISSISPAAFDNMPNLNRIDLDHNSLTEWNDNWFTNTPNIHFLSVNFNKISALPARSFKNFKGKHQEHGKSPILTSIYMANNQIEEVDAKAFKGLKQLEFLDLDHNNIATLEVNTFKDIESVRYLMLTGNKITCMPEAFLNNLPSMELLTINENPLDCNCLKDMRKWAKQHQVSIQMNIRAIECMQQRIKDTLDSVKDIN